MSEAGRVTEAGAAPPPLASEAEVVELMFLRDQAGAPVRVQVSPLDELELIDLLGALPGQREPDTEAPGSLGEMWRQFRPVAAQIIERACLPRFSFANPVPEGVLPGAWLRDSEKLALVLTALRVSGWMGGAAQSAASFLRGRSGAVAPGAGTPLDGSARALDAVPGEQQPAERAVRAACEDGT
jgi:hypothetical protein